MRPSNGSKHGARESMLGWGQGPCLMWSSLWVIIYQATFVLTSGPILTPFGDEAGDTFPHSMEPQLRALGLHTSLVKGVPSLNASHQLCRSGDSLTSEQCRILKLLGVQMAVRFPPSPHDLADR